MFKCVNSFWQFLNYWYFRYLMVTELYMVEKWERAVCKHDLDLEKHRLVFRMTFLQNEETLQDYAIPEGGTLMLVEDFRPAGRDGINVILKVEGLLCSAFFDPEVSLWTVVRSLVASETLALADHVPIIMSEDEEYTGPYTLQENRLHDVAEGRRAIFRFKVVSMKRSISKKSLLDEDSLSRSDVFSIRTTGLDSTSSRSTPDDRYVSFKKGEELMEVISQDLEEVEQSAEGHRRTTASSARHRRSSTCCALL